MFFKQRANDDASISYFLGCGGQGKGIAVDVLAGDTAWLIVLPDTREIFPGHQAGSACGADISGKPSSTIGFEKRWNRLLSLGKEEFVSAVTANIPPRPPGMDDVVAANLGQHASV